MEIYGTNETNTLAMATPDDQDRYPDSNGRLVAGIEAQVVDESGSFLRFGEIGQIRVRGRYFPCEYSGNPEATARHFRDGWFYPGDLATMNEEGYVFLKGRIDDVINNAGAKYFPAEVEAVLLAHPSVVDAAVIGGPHTQFGEVSVAYVVRSANLTPKELYKFCEGKIAMYKAPAWVFFLEALPRVATGKPDKKKLRETFRHYLKTQPR
jgi:acyl-CoA synthetase (AMP-forming)/AMP-acid ligase II